MRVIKKSEVREIIIGHVEFTLIFLFDDFLCKIAILEPLKVRFLDKKQKLLSDDGTKLSYFLKKLPVTTQYRLTLPGRGNFSRGSFTRPKVALK